MSTQATHAERPAAGSSSGRRTMALVVGVLGVGLMVWTGLRIGAAMKSRAQIAAAAADGARAAEAARAAERGAAGAAGARSVQTLRAEAIRWRPSLPVEGTLLPIQESDLGFKTGGRLERLAVKAGDRVRAGALLGSLQSEEAAAQARAAAAQVKAAQAQLTLALDASRRTEQLLGVNAAPQASGVQVEGQRTLAAAQLEGARAQLALARTALANHRLTAPFGGTITRVPGGVGAVVGPGVPLFHLADTARLKLSGTLAEIDAAMLRPGDEVEVRLDDGRLLRGAVRALLPSVETATRRVPLEAVLPNNVDPPARGGTFVRAVARARAEVSGVRLPPTVLRPGAQDELFVVQGGRAQVRRVLFVRDGNDAGGALLVRSGLAAGDEVVDRPPAELVDGQPVRAAAGTAPAKGAAPAQVRP